jgi:energy-coupling factor transport system permease protein
MWANILLCTTLPIELMNGIRFFLTPLKLFKVPVDNLTLIISVAIQFIPTLLNEASNIKKAQIARGAQFESKNIFKKAAAVLPLIIPIFVSAFKRADELSQALEARGYQGSE